MELGPKLKEIRRQKGLTMQQVADQAELSKSFISQIESGSATPSIAALKKIGDALGIPLAAIFEEGQEDSRDHRFDEPEREEDEVRVVRHDRRKRVALPGRASMTELLTPDVQRRLEVLLDVQEPGDESNGEPYTHTGEEFGFVLEGTYEVTVADRTYVLEAGDSIYYPSRLPHANRAIGDRPAKTIWVITPPSF